MNLAGKQYRLGNGLNVTKSDVFLGKSGREASLGHNPELEDVYWKM